MGFVNHQDPRLVAYRAKRKANSSHAKAARKKAAAEQEAREAGIKAIEAQGHSRVRAVAIYSASIRSR